MVEGMGMQPWPAQYDVEAMGLVEKCSVLLPDVRMGQVRDPTTNNFDRTDLVKSVKLSVSICAQCTPGFHMTCEGTIKWMPSN